MCLEFLCSSFPWKGGDLTAEQLETDVWVRKLNILSWLNILDWLDDCIVASAPGLVMAWILTVKQVIAPEAFYGLYEKTVYLEAASFFYLLLSSYIVHV